MHITPETGGAFLLGALFMLAVLVIFGHLQ
jgi:hypothetical protein